MPTSTAIWNGCCKSIYPVLGFAFLTCIYSNNDITDALELTFSTEDERFGETVSIELKPGGEHIEVTNENKREYVE
jgi:hypothetical protein